MDYVTELYYDGAWRDISADVRDAEPVTITRGRRDWASASDPATCKLRLNNGASAVVPGQFGRYSPRNPRSDLYGLIGRNTPIRLRRTVRRNEAIVVPGTAGSYLSTPSAAAWSGITSDLDVRCDLDAGRWQTATGSGSTFRVLIARWDTRIGGGLDWALYWRSDGGPRITWTTDGTTDTRTILSPDEVIAADAGRLTVRATLDGDDGAGNHVVRFYTGPSLAGPWTQLGSTITTVGTTSIHDSEAEATIGAIAGGRLLTPGGLYSSTVYGAEVRSGIDGEVVSQLGFSGYEPDQRDVTDAQGHTWTLHGAATFTDPSIRFVGECSVWPPQWDLSGADQWASIEAAGISRRLQRGTKPLPSSLYRDLSTKENIVAYWPLEEPSGATQFASGLAGVSAVLRPGDADQVDVAANDEAFAASSPLPEVHDTTISGAVPPYDPDVAQRFIVAVMLPSEGLASEKILFRWRTAGTIARWDMTATAAGGIRLYAYDRDDNQLSEQGIVIGLNGVPVVLSLWLEQDGSDVFWQVAIFPVGADFGTIFENTIPGRTYGRFTTAALGSTNDVEGTVIGHAALMNGDVHSIWDLIGRSLDAWSGETAAERVIRLAGDSALSSVHLIGDAADTTPLGPQPQQPLMSLLREAATADLGILGDRPDALGLVYRTRASLYNQTPALVLDYATGVIGEPFRLVDDDQNTRNNIRLERYRGSSATVRAETGPLSVADPPDGVGEYDYTETVSLASDGQLPYQASWRLHLGTVDEPRIPLLHLDLRNPRVAAIVDDALNVGEGDLIRITNLPPQIPPGPIDLLVDASAERKSASTHTIEFTCAPASPWTVGVWADTTETPAPEAPMRYDTAGTIRDGADIDATQTAITLTTINGPLWTTDPVDFPLDIMVGGERMRVNSIDSETTDGQQLFQVQRSVNGVVKSHPAGTPVSLYQPARYAL